MEDGHSGTDALDGLPAAYASWRASTLGQVTDRLELDLMLEMIGRASGPRLLDVGLAANLLAPLDGRLGRLTTLGAALLVLAATKPDDEVQA